MNFRVRVGERRRRSYYGSYSEMRTRRSSGTSSMNLVVSAARGQQTPATAKEMTACRITKGVPPLAVPVFLQPRVGLLCRGRAGELLRHHLVVDSGRIELPPLRRTLCAAVVRPPVHHFRLDTVNSATRVSSGNLRLSCPPPDRQQARPLVNAGGNESCNGTSQAHNSPRPRNPTPRSRQ